MLVESQLILIKAGKPIVPKDRGTWLGTITTKRELGEMGAR
jgi:hypothetical protein